MPKNEEEFEVDDLPEGEDEIEEESDTEDDVDTAAGPILVADDDTEEDDGPDTDVELALDEVLAERVRVTTEDEEDDDDEPIADPDEKLDANETVLPQQDDEFRCNSCHLLKKNSQLADKKQMLCRDCL
mgnify:CR=1 FL=1